MHTQREELANQNQQLRGDLDKCIAVLKQAVGFHILQVLFLLPLSDHILCIRVLCSHLGDQDSLKNLNCGGAGLWVKSNEYC